MPKDNLIPEEYYCPISHQIMIDPVTAADDNTYEREKIEEWLKIKDTSPLTNEKLQHKELTGNLYARRQILNFLDSHPELYDGDEVYLPKSWVAQLGMAIKSNQHQAVQRWLDKDRRLLTVKLEGDSTALHLACEFGSPELVGALLKTLKRRNKLVIPGNPAYRPVHLNVLLEKALTSAGRTKCELLLSLGAEIEQREASTQNTLVHRMVIGGYPESASWLLEKEASLESRNFEGNTPLLLSVIHNHTKLTELLLKKGASSQVKNAEQQSPVLIALLNQNESMLSLLVGAKKAALPSLHLALELNDNGILKVLLRHSADAIETLDEQEKTPFYSAVEKGNVEAARLLLAKGANPSVTWGTAQLNALHVASERGDIEMLEYLLQTHALTLIDAQNANGDTPLHLAVQTGQANVISLLLEAGSYHKTKNEQDQTPIELARAQQKPKLANLIVKTVRDLKQTKLEKTQTKLEEVDRLRQVVAEQASEIANLRTALQRQGQGFKAQLFDVQKEQARKIEQLEAALRCDAKNALEKQGIGFEKQLSNVQQSIFPMLHQFQAAEEEKRRLEKTRLERIQFEEKQLEEKHAAKKKETLRAVPEFLRLVAEGEQDQAEAMLKSNPNLALISGDVTDLSKRTFNAITGFQYAVWALDWHMWTMIRKYLSPEEAQVQAQGFETGSWVGSYGAHANLNTLIQAYQAMTELYQAQKLDEGDAVWVKQVGGAQLLLPAHVINEYCHPQRCFYPLPNFKNPAILPRTRQLNQGEWFTVLDSGGFAAVRGEPPVGTRVGWGAAMAAWVGWSWRESDCKAVSALSTTRAAQREELIAELKPRITQIKAA